MAEAITAAGLAASIVTFADVSTKALARLREFHSITQEVPSVIQDITTQLPVIVDIMTRIEKRCGGSSLTADEQHRLSHVVDGCFRQVTLLNGLIEKMLPNLTDSKWQRTRKAIASIRKEKVIAVIQRTLETYKSTLTLHFSQGARASTFSAIRECAYYEIPSLRVSQFVERVELLEKIKASFANTTTNTSYPRTVVLLGMGGQGKTQLALEYCRVATISGRYQGVFWVDASSPITVSHGFETIAAKLSRGDRVLDDMDSKIAFVKETLGRWQMSWLLVFDNYDQPGEFRNIAAYFPHGEAGEILIISRHADSERLGVTIRVTRMTEDEGLELLLRRTNQDRSDDNATEGRKIIQKLGHLPLAIDQAGAYINMRKLPLPLFTKHYDERREVVLNHTPSLWEYHRRLGEDKDETLLSVFTTWELSFRQIGNNDDERAIISHFLTLSAFFDASNVGENLFRSYLTLTDKPPWWMEHFTSGGVWDQYKYQDTIVELLNLSLLQGVNIGGIESSFSLHPLVTDWLKLRIDQENRQKYTIEAVMILSSYIDTQDQDIISLRTRLDMLSHVDMCLLNGREYLRGLDESNIASIPDSASTFALLYHNQGRLEDAEAMYQRALTGFEKTLGPIHESTLNAVGNLGILHMAQGRLEDAEVMYQRALTGFEKTLGSTYESTLITVGNLGIIYEAQGRLEDAEAMYQRALAGFEKALGPAHTSTLDIVGNLGTLYNAQGRLEDAEAMYQRALTGFEKTLGPAHESTLITVANLGNVYVTQGRLEDAEAMYRQALTGLENTLGPAHTSTLGIVNNLGNLYKSQGRLADAEAILA
ncbi:hypothetical protein GP486_007398 [Trichoglossum hirsutum]|uniref:NACHT-NTPase and P-loop NTPases N-terminal domain-containing protein n=1 Tax=Trichoglossum hirsutum TaxID=265104 RepID=A0A9P8ICT6_9PEZI|nr:hypothetical protein GP486_007398 [Trichoglossum hirsutum]